VVHKGGEGKEVELEVAVETSSCPVLLDGVAKGVGTVIIEVEFTDDLAQVSLRSQAGNTKVPGSRNAWPFRVFQGLSKKRQAHFSGNPILLFRTELGRVLEGCEVKKVGESVREVARVFRLPQGMSPFSLKQRHDRSYRRLGRAGPQDLASRRLGFFKPLQIQAILRPSCRTLAGDEIVEIQESDRNISVGGHLPPSPGFLEGQSLHVGQDVDPIRLDADLEDGAGMNEILDRNALQWGSELCKCLPGSRGILRRGLDPEVEIFGVARDGVEDHGVRADDQETDVSGGEGGEQISEVAVHRHLRLAEP
jgi:hypothetical protein